MSNIKITDNSARVRAALELAKDRILTGCALTGATNSADELLNSPRRVDTGRLRNSVNGKVKGNSAVIGTNVEYAIYVHQGTYRMSPNRFLRNGIERHVGDYRKIIDYELKNTQI